MKVKGKREDTTLVMNDATLFSPLHDVTVCF